MKRREMEELLDGLDCSLRVTGLVGDSIMMGIVNSAMEEAYDRILCSREGGLECLNDKSRFCGLAIMQLEWCLKFLQEEMDACVVESDDERERLVADLRVIRDRIRMRLEETESAIAGKERELEDMSESESELRRVLESKDEELRSLRTSLELERARNGGVQEGTALGDEKAEDGEVASCELRMFIVQHLEDFSYKLIEAKTHISDLIQKLGIYGFSTVESSETVLKGMEEEGTCDYSGKIVNEVKYMRPNEGGVVQLQCPEVHPNSDAEILRCTLKADLDNLFKQLGLEMSILKTRLLLAFETADEAICFSKAAVDEQQLRWSFEKETLYVLMANFLKDVEKSCRSKVLREAGNISLAIPNISWSSLMKKFASLNSNMEQLGIQLDGQLETSSFVESLTCHMKDRANEDSADQFNHFDAKVERSHQSAIRKKPQEAAWLRAVEKGLPFLQNFREFRIMKAKITEIISKLECFMEESSKLAALFDDFRSAYEMERFAVQDNLSRSESAEKVNDVVHISSGIPTKISNKTTFYPMADDIHEEIRYLKEDGEDLFIKSIVLEETNTIFFNVFVKELNLEFVDYKLETLLREDICWLIFKETMKERICEIEICYSERATMEEMDRAVLSNLIEDMKTTGGLGFKRCGEENLSYPSTFFQGPYIAEDIVQRADKLIIQGADMLSLSCEVEEDLLPNPIFEIMEPQMRLVWNSQVSTEHSPNHGETLDDDDEAFSSVRSKLEKALQQLTKSKIQLRELGSDMGVSLEAKEHTVDKFEQHTEQTSCLHIKNGEEGCNEVQPVPDKEQTSCLCIKNREEGCDEVQSILDKEHASCLHTKNGEGCNEIQPVLGKEQTCLHTKNAEGCNEIQPVLGKEQTSCLHIKNGEEGCNEVQPVLDKEQTSCLHIKNGEEVCIEVQPVLAKEQALRLRTKNGEEGCNEVQPVVGKEQTSHLHIKNGEEGCKKLQSVLSHLSDFSQAILDLELVVYKKTQANMLRLEGLNCRLNLLVQQASSLRKTELLYRKAFIRRCYNLQTAEAEVDLLGDEVDAFLGLLEKIYVVLNHYSPVLQYYSGIMDILKLIKKELFWDVTVKSH